MNNRRSMFMFDAVPDSNLIIRRLASYRMVVCASPEYLAKYGRPALGKKTADAGIDMRFPAEAIFCRRQKVPIRPRKRGWRSRNSGVIAITFLDAFG